MCIMLLTLCDDQQDVTSSVFDYLGIPDLVMLGCTCRALRGKVTDVIQERLKRRRIEVEDQLEHIRWSSANNHGYSMSAFMLWSGASMRAMERIRLAYLTLEIEIDEACVTLSQKPGETKPERYWHHQIGVEEEWDGPIWISTLHYAAAVNDVQLCQVLLERGHPVNANVIMAKDAATYEEERRIVEEERRRLEEERIRQVPRETIVREQIEREVEAERRREELHRKHMRWQQEQEDQQREYELQMQVTTSDGQAVRESMIALQDEIRESMAAQQRRIDRGEDFDYESSANDTSYRYSSSDGDGPSRGSSRAANDNHQDDSVDHGRSSTGSDADADQESSNETPSPLEGGGGDSSSAAPSSTSGNQASNEASSPSGGDSTSSGNNQPPGSGSNDEAPLPLEGGGGDSSSSASGAAVAAIPPAAAAGQPRRMDGGSGSSTTNNSSSDGPRSQSEGSGADADGSDDESSNGDGEDGSSYDLQPLEWGTITPLRVAMTFGCQEVVELLQSKGGEAGIGVEVSNPHYPDLSLYDMEDHPPEELPNLPPNDPENGGACWVNPTKREVYFLRPTVYEDEMATVGIVFKRDMQSTFRKHYRIPRDELEGQGF